MKKEHISLLSTADLDVQRAGTSVDLTSTHLHIVELKTKCKSGSPAAHRRTIRPTISFPGLQMWITAALSRPIRPTVLLVWTTNGTAAGPNRT